MTTPNLRDAAPKRIFIPGKLVNPLNGSHGHWSRAAKYRKAWRGSVAEHAVIDRWRAAFPRANTPKSVVILAHVWNLFDATEGLRAACKPIIDGLGPATYRSPNGRVSYSAGANVIHSDGPACGHEFSYSQVVDRKHLGVTITIEELTNSTPPQSSPATSGAAR